jgi:hypothetical protein
MIEMQQAVDEGLDCIERIAGEMEKDCVGRVRRQSVSTPVTARLEQGFEVRLVHLPTQRQPRLSLTSNRKLLGGGGRVSRSHDSLLPSCSDGNEKRLVLNAKELRGVSAVGPPLFLLDRRETKGSGRGLRLLKLDENAADVFVEL